MNWDQIVEAILPSIVKIETPQGHGTGFLCFCNEAKNVFGIATANHVVEHADKWHEPIRIHHFPSNSTVLLKEPERVIYVNPFMDSALIVASFEQLQLPQEPIPLLPTDDRLPLGMEVGWLGYPAIDEENTLCFFSGTVSAWNDFRKAYLIDGVAINGISGGPVVYFAPEAGVQIIGTITAYRANRNTGETLPGLSIAQDVSHFHDTIARIKSFQEATVKKKELEQPNNDVPAGPLENKTTKA
jgi:hypothetical protein